MIVVVGFPRGLKAQRWNDAPVRELVARAAAARGAAIQDTMTPFRAYGRGLVTYRFAWGEAGEAPPTLVRADQLQVEVYWRSPRWHKQVLAAWQDTVLFPNRITYHRDHLALLLDRADGTLQFGNGDEVAAVPHPLAAGGVAQYDFALGDTIRLATHTETLDVVAVEVRPRNPDRPAAAGTLYIDRTSAALVRVSFTFTPSSYRDPTVRRITAFLEYARLDGRWVPWRQDLAIERRSAPVAIPFQGVIDARWQIDSVRWDPSLADSALYGPTIAGARAPSGRWDREAGALLHAWAPPWQHPPASLDALATSLQADPAYASRLTLQPRVRHLSDFVRMTRVEGVALGAGAAVARGPFRVEARTRIGLEGGGFQANVAVTRSQGPVAVTIRATREVVDLADRPLGSTGVNSLTAGLGGADHGDYWRRESVGVEVTRALGRGGRLLMETALLRAEGLTTAASPLFGTFRDNPDLGHRAFGLFRSRITWPPGLFSRREADFHLEVGAGAGTYLRGAGYALFGVGPLDWSVEAGWGSARLPAFRSFAIGGWGTLLGERFRAWGGRTSVRTQVALPFTIPTVSIGLGPYGRTTPRMTLAPFLAAGWTDRASGLPWAETPGIRPVLGLRATLPFEVVEITAGWALRPGRVGVQVDLGRRLQGVF